MATQISTDIWTMDGPDVVFAEEELVKKVPSLANVQILTNLAPEVYSHDVDQVIFGGNRLFQEAGFFHKASGSLRAELCAFLTEFGD